MQKTQEHLDISSEKEIFPSATMERRIQVATMAQNLVRSGLSNEDGPFADISHYKILYDISNMAEGKIPFISRGNGSIDSVIMGFRSIQPYLGKIEWYSIDNKGKTTVQTIAEACHKKSIKGSNGVYFEYFKNYFEKLLDVFCEIMRDDSIQISSRYVEELALKINK